MQSLTNQIADLLTDAQIHMLLRLLVILVSGLLAFRLLPRLAARLAGLRFQDGGAQLARRLTSYALVVIFSIWVLGELGFDVTVLLGAAGVLTVALGFASQTVASNAISGFFLLGERPFQVGDVITVAGRTGEVVETNLLSVKLRTSDNLAVRIPNEALLKSEVVNRTYYPIRRLDLAITLPIGADLGRARDEVLGLADRNPLCLDEPRPRLMLERLDEVGTRATVAVWVARESFGEVRDALLTQLPTALAGAGIRLVQSAPTVVQAAPSDLRVEPL
jgi:small-conductance mechanosensitive channel